jgi:DNA-binding response OmpR family regulator
MTDTRVLVIDDDPGILKATAKALAVLGYEPETASRFEGVAAVAEVQPRAILLDVFLLDQDGLAVARELKASEQTRVVPLIMFSAHPQVEQKVYASGADDFLPKPFNLSDLEKKLGQWIPRSGGGEETS